MTLHARLYFLATTTCMVLAAAGCATTALVPALVAGRQATVDGTIASIDTKPWTYDGNAVVLLDTAAHGRVSVQLPARWNLCKAAHVDVASLAVGQRVRAIGTFTDDGHVVVCERAEHHLGAVD